jgi:uncharacterized protein YegL
MSIAPELNGDAIMREYSDNTTMTIGDQPLRFGIPKAIPMVALGVLMLSITFWVAWTIRQLNQDFHMAQAEVDKLRGTLTTQSKEVADINSRMRANAAEHRDDLLKLSDRLTEAPIVAKPTLLRAASVAMKNDLKDVNLDRRISMFPAANEVAKSVQIEELTIEHANDVTIVRFKALNADRQFNDSIRDGDIIVRCDGVPLLQTRLSLGYLRPNRKSFTAVLLDVSSSMEGEKIVRAKEAVRQLVRSIANPTRVKLWVFATDVKALSPLTIDSELIELSLNSVKADGATSMNAAIAAAANDLEGLQGDRTILLVTDGRDSGDPNALKAAIDKCVSNKIRVHIVALSNAEVDLRTLEGICTATNGRLTTVQSVSQLEKSLVAAGEAMQEPTYLLSFLTPRKPFSAMTIQVAGLPEMAISVKKEPSTPVVSSLPRQPIDR